MATQRTTGSSSQSGSSSSSTTGQSSTSTQQQQDFWSNFWSQFYNRSAPWIRPEYRGLEELLRNFALRRMQQPSGLPGGFESSGVRNINQGTLGARQSIQNRLSSVGLGRSAAAGAAMLPLETARTGAIADFRTGLPLLERQLSNEDAALASGILSGFGKGMESQGTTEGGQTGGMTGTTNSQTQFGSNTTGSYQGTSQFDQTTKQTKSLFENLMGMLGFMGGMGIFGGGGQSSSANPLEALLAQYGSTKTPMTPFGFPNFG